MKKLSVLLLNPPFKTPIIRDNYCCFTSKSGYVWPPTDLLYLSAVLKHPQIDLHVIDAVVEKRNSWDVISSFVKLKKIMVIVCLTGTASFKKDMVGLEHVKNESGCRAYVLGNTPVFMPAEFLKTYPFIDGIFHNFFDLSVLNEVLNGKSRSKSISKITSKGLKIGVTRYLKSGLEISLTQPPHYNIFPLGKYSTPISMRKPIATSLTTFGCPFKCDFCIASALDYFPRKISNMEMEFDYMKKSGVKEIFFQDSTFNTNPIRVRKLLNMMINNKYNFSWSSNIHSFWVNDELIGLMKEAGCHTVQIGVESGNKHTLSIHAPSKDKKNLKKAFNLCHKHGLRTLGYFIIGFPNEGVDETKNTIDFAIELDPTMASFSVLTPDYGTKLYIDLMKLNKVNKSALLEFDSSQKAEVIGKMSKNQQAKMINRAYVRFYLRPKVMLRFIMDYKRLWLYIKNGLFLVFNKMI